MFSTAAIITNRRAPFALYNGYSSVFLLFVLSAMLNVNNVDTKYDPQTAPEKLTQGCSPELLHLRSHRHFHVMCRTQPSIAVAAYEGMHDAMRECRENMRFQPWDCSQISTVLHDTPILRLGSKSH
ncbi:hypothetical protein AB6A40_010698 [Gnathostoma spinigerum]|uniref:Protein Wnt n=1 Tax=Gnathostoma spinigerum TaxID=75299 RepID=A0ABD6F222_9BILA